MSSCSVNSVAIPIHEDCSGALPDLISNMMKSMRLGPHDKRFDIQTRSGLEGQHVQLLAPAHEVCFYPPSLTVVMANLDLQANIILPHFLARNTDRQNVKLLVKARWFEHVIEDALLGSKESSERARFQHLLVQFRLERAKLEVELYANALQIAQVPSPIMATAVVQVSQFDYKLYLSCTLSESILVTSKPLPTNNANKIMIAAREVRDNFLFLICFFILFPFVPLAPGPILTTICCTTRFACA